MAITGQILAQSVLDWIDVPSIAAASTSQVQGVLNAVNGALQELFEEGPSHFKRREWATTVYGPTNVTLNVVNNSTAITFATGWQAWMKGCTIRIDLDNGGTLATNTVLDNELVDNTTLLQPYQGAAASGIAAIVYGDAITMDPTISAVMADPRLAGIRQLRAAPNREAFNKASWYYEGDYGEALLQVQSRPRWIGQPHTYWVDTVYSATTGATQPVLRIRLTPLPDGQYVLRWDAEMNPPSLVAANLSDPDYVFQLPSHNDELILMAFVNQRFTASPWFKNDKALAEIKRQYDQAYKALYGSRPQKNRNRRIIPIR